MIMGEIKQKREEYKEEVRDVFVLGDFNLPENSHLLHTLEKSDLKLESVRKNLLRRHLKDQCDLGHTFEAFAHDEHDVENPKKIIDHMYVASKDYEPTRFEVVRELAEKVKHGKQQMISDHFPIMGVFRHKRSKSSLQKMAK
jgi:endonuclease/exonuclease/phosphatase family metal-dependent hydrolase